MKLFLTFVAIIACEQSSLLTLIVTMESVSLCTRMKS
jgi:hypothetical protein